MQINIKSCLFTLARLLLMVIMAIPLNGCHPRLPEGMLFGPGTYLVDAGQSQFPGRDYYLHVPPGYASEQPRPLVVVLHGAFSSAIQTEKETGFSLLADQEGFLVAYPQGIGLFGMFKHWNAGFCCGGAVLAEVDDVGFLAEVIRSVGERFNLDRNRIYMAGMSNGGMMTYRYAAERGDGLAAFAVVSAAIGFKESQQSPPWRLPRPKHPLPVIAFHGLADRAIPVIENSSAGDGEQFFLPVSRAIEFWSAVNQCRSRLSDDRWAPAVRREFRGDCKDDAVVDFYLLEGWGHQWPGRWFSDQLPEGSPLKGFDATSQIWNFFKHHRRVE